MEKYEFLRLYGVANMPLVDQGRCCVLTYIRDIIIKIYSRIMFIDHSMRVMTHSNSPHKMIVVGADLSAVIVGKNYRVEAGTDYITSGSLERQLWSLFYTTMVQHDTVRIIEPDDDIKALLAQIDDGLY